MCQRFKETTLTIEIGVLSRTEQRRSVKEEGCALMSCPPSFRSKLRYSDGARGGTGERSEAVGPIRVQPLPQWLYPFQRDPGVTASRDHAYELDPLPFAFGECIPPIKGGRAGMKVLTVLRVMATFRNGSGW